MVRGVIFDLDDTLYAYEPANRAGEEAIAAYAQETFHLSPKQFLITYAQGRTETKQILPDSGAAHSRLLYVQHTLEILGLTTFPYAYIMEEIFWDAFLAQIELFDGALTLFRKLCDRNMKIAICTDLTAAIQYRKIERLGLNPFVNFLVTSEEVGHEKPHPGIFQMALRKMRLEPREVLMIGDHWEKDIQGAKNLGIKALWFKPQGDKPKVKAWFRNYHEGKAEEWCGIR